MMRGGSASIDDRRSHRPAHRTGCGTSPEPPSTPQSLQAVSIVLRVRSKEYSQLPPGHFTLRDVRSYRRLYSGLPRNAVTCEIGCFMGKSICAVADIIKAKDMSVHIVDAFGDVVTGGNHDPDLLAECKSNLARYRILERAVFHVGYSAEMAMEVADGQFDLVFIDANHELEHVRQDIALYRRKLKLGGILSGHDYGNPCGVKAAVDLDVPGHYLLRDSLWAARIDGNGPYLGFVRHALTWSLRAVGLTG
jgi:SAM-dependent methyltransferase